MENIILSMLFIYPGALVDSLYEKFANTKFTDDNVSQIRLLARYFVFSTIISVLALILFSLINTGTVQSLPENINLIKTDWNLFYYLCISLFSTVLFAAIFWIFRKIVNIVYNYFRSKNKGYTVDDSYSIWGSLIEDKDINIKNLIGCIKKDEMIITAGWVKAIPSDIQKEPALLLYWTEYFREIFKEDSENIMKIIGNPKVEYMHLPSGFLISLYDGTAYLKTISVLEAAVEDQSA